jgi:hypothetical protein
MENGIRIKVITFPPDRDNPLPYIGAFCEWNDHVDVCAQCAHVDQRAKASQFFNPMELCEGGSLLQLTVTRRIAQQHLIARWN